MDEWQKDMKTPLDHVAVAHPSDEIHRLQCDRLFSTFCAPLCLSLHILLGWC